MFILKLSRYDAWKATLKVLGRSPYKEWRGAQWVQRIPVSTCRFKVHVMYVVRMWPQYDIDHKDITAFIRAILSFSVLLPSPLKMQTTLWYGVWCRKMRTLGFRIWNQDSSNWYLKNGSKVILRNETEREINIWTSHWNKMGSWSKDRHTRTNLWARNYWLYLETGTWL